MKQYYVLTSKFKVNIYAYKLKTIIIVLISASFIYCYIAINTPNYTGPKSDHFDGLKFFNPITDDLKKNKKSAMTILKWQMNRVDPNWPKYVPNSPVLNPVKYTKENIKVTYIGHATTLIQVPGCNILSDPIWSDYASPVQFAGPKRVKEPAMSLSELPPIDLIIISHCHYDHLDLDTIKKLTKMHNPTIIAPLGNQKTLSKATSDNKIITLDWHQDYIFSKNNIYTKISLEPAEHWAQRWILNRNKELWGSFVVTSQAGKVYFAGDTAYSEKNFQSIFNRHGPIDIALLPIGAYTPREIMKYSHTNPEEAVMAHKILQAKQSIGIHFDTFANLTDEPYGMAGKDLEIAKNKHQVKNFWALEAGEHVSN